MPNSPRDNGDVTLTPREIDVLRLVSTGLSNKEIAQEMLLAEKTVEHMLSNDGGDLRAIYPKIGVRNRSGAAAWYVEKYGAPGNEIDTTVPRNRLLEVFLEDNAVLARRWANITDEQIAHLRRHTSPHEVGMRLRLIGNGLARQYLWEDAIPLYRKAEQLFGPASSEAARSACIIATAYTDLGEYAKAGIEVARIEQVYGSVADPETRVRLSDTKGLLAYYTGDLLTAETRFLNTLALVEEIGAEHLGETAQHFLGRTYAAMAQNVANRREAGAWFLKAEARFDEAYRIHGSMGREINQAWDLFRKAQMLQDEGRRHEARTLRKKARQMFGPDLGVLLVDLDEARLALETGDSRFSVKKVEDALRRLAQVNKADGIMEALHVLGRAEHIRGRVERALELYVAALATSPPEAKLQNRQLWATIRELSNAVISAAGNQGYAQLVDRIEARAKDRSGYFSYLNNLAADRSKWLLSIIDDLRKLDADERLPASNSVDPPV